MINEHLLKKGLSIDEVQAFVKTRAYRDIRKLPAYTIACCPYCRKENIEHLDSYTLTVWWSVSKAEPKKEAFFEGKVSHCEHFVVAQTFVFITETNDYQFNRAHNHYNNLFDMLLGRRNQYFFVPQKAFVPPKPMVMGFILENQLAKAVLHVLPICEYTAGDFVPAHLLYIITYFSEQPEDTQAALEEMAYSRAGEDGWPTLTTFLPYGEQKKWYNLPYWVERGILYWVNPYAIEQNYDPDNCLLTGDVAAFPYKNPRKLVEKQ